MADILSDAPSPSVPDAFDILARALAASGLSDGGDFQRAGTFREAVLKLRDRWVAGEPPHTPRTATKKAQPTPAPDAEPPPFSRPSNG